MENNAIDIKISARGSGRTYAEYGERLTHALDKVLDWTKQGKKPIIHKVIDRRFNDFVGIVIMVNEPYSDAILEVFTDAQQFHEQEIGDDCDIEIKKVGEINV